MLPARALTPSRVRRRTVCSSDPRLRHRASKWKLRPIFVNETPRDALLDAAAPTIVDPLSRVDTGGLSTERQSTRWAAAAGFVRDAREKAGLSDRQIGLGQTRV